MIYRFDGKTPEIQAGAYISELAVIIGDVKVSRDCYIGHGAILRGDYGRIEIGEGTAIEEGVIVHAPPQDICSIGEQVTIGHGAIIHSELICNLVSVGMGAVLSLRSIIGEETVIAESAVVRMRQQLPPRVVAAGNPARVIRGIEKKDQEFWSNGKQLYINLARKYLEQGMERIQ